MKGESSGFIIKTGFIYLLKIHLNVIVALIVASPVMLIAGFFTESEIIRHLVTGIAAFATELILCFLLFRKEVLSYRKISLKELLFTCSFALALHFVISLICQFYAYAAGIGISSLSTVWGSVLAGEYLEKYAEVPIYTSIVLFLVKLALMLLSIILAYYMGTREGKQD